MFGLDKYMFNLTHGYTCCGDVIEHLDNFLVVKTSYSIVYVNIREIITAEKVEETENGNKNSKR